MTIFRFRLATLLRLRESLRDERRGQLAEAQQAEQMVVERIASIDGELSELERRARDASRAGVVDVDRLSDATRYKMILKVERQSADQQRQVVTEEVQKRRAALMIADRDVRVLEKLRETQQQQYDDEAARREFKRLDEMAVLRHSREEAP